MRYAGLGGPQDYAAALHHFTSAAEGGQPWAQHALGFMHETGKGTEKSFNSAIEWYKRAAERGLVPAICAVALILKFAPEGIRNYAEAAKLFRRAAEAGNCMAALQLADCLERGFGVAVDRVAAREWYLRAADLKDESTAAAHAAIAALYRTGRLDFPVDARKADEWTKSSQQLLQALQQDRSGSRDDSQDSA